MTSQTLQKLIEKTKRSDLFYFLIQLIGAIIALLAITLISIALVEFAILIYKYTHPQTDPFYELLGF